MQPGAVLTTTEAAGMAAVAPSTIKRWADQGLLPFSRTAGGHRRFERFAIERFLGEQTGSTSVDDSPSAAWIRCSIAARPYESDGRMLEARSRLGSWGAVADAVAVALTEIGAQWERGRLSIA
jgi:excisionase family DNA binding protein